MKRFSYLLATAAVSASQHAVAADSLCSVVKTFETAAAEKVEKPRERRWVEFHWGFDHSPDALWSWGCRHSDGQVAAQTCAWLRNHTNQEFTMVLPQDIMACYGYRFPRHASIDWIGMIGTIRLHGKADRRLLLDLAYNGLPQGEQAMRLAVEIDDVEYEPDELPPIAPMPAEKAGAAAR